jgi:hypothetical protein
MSTDLQDIIRQADLLIKEGKYKSAWNLLLPHKADPAVRKRLTWLDQKRKQSTTSENKVSTPANSGRSRLYALIALVVILVVGGFGIYRLSQQNAVPSTPTLESTSAAAVATATTESVTATPTIVLSPTATDIPPTENGQEVTLQQKLREWLAAVKGVSKVLSFDVDIPGDEPPLGYVEVVVDSGFNDTNIPDQIAEKLKTELKTTEFSDLAVIMSDGSTTTEYDYDSKGSSWNQTQLSSTPKPAD